MKRIPAMYYRSDAGRWLRTCPYATPAVQARFQHGFELSVGKVAAPHPDDLQPLLRPVGKVGVFRTACVFRALTSVSSSGAVARPRRLTRSDGFSGEPPGQAWRNLRIRQEAQALTGVGRHGCNPCMVLPHNRNVGELPDRSGSIPWTRPRSGGDDDAALGRRRAEGQSRSQIRFGQIGIVGKYLGRRHSIGQHAETIANPNPGASDKRTSAADRGIRMDAFSEIQVEGSIDR